MCGCLRGGCRSYGPTRRTVPFGPGFARPWLQVTYRTSKRRTCVEVVPRGCGGLTGRSARPTPCAVGHLLARELHSVAPRRKDLVEVRRREDGFECGRLYRLEVRNAGDRLCAGPRARASSRRSREHGHDFPAVDRRATGRALAGPAKPRVSPHARRADPGCETRALLPLPTRRDRALRAGWIRCGRRSGTCSRCTGRPDSARTDARPATARVCVDGAGLKAHGRQRICSRSFPVGLRGMTKSRVKVTQSSTFL
jgi:hypothetical protein